MFVTGELRAYNLYAGQSGGNCVDINGIGNPYGFYGLIAQGCKKQPPATGTRVGINLVSTAGAQFFGVAVFGNDINVSVSRTTEYGSTANWGAEFALTTP